MACAVFVQSFAIVSALICVAVLAVWLIRLRRVHIQEIHARDRRERCGNRILIFGCAGNVGKSVLSLLSSKLRPQDHTSLFFAYHIHQPRNAPDGSNLLQVPCTRVKVYAPPSLLRKRAPSFCVNVHLCLL